MSSKNKTTVKVIHDFDDFVEDREVILTLKDVGILEGSKAYEGPDVLQNVKLAEAYRSQVKSDNRKQVLI